MLQEVFLEAGIAVKNPDFDATKPYDEAIKIIHPNMLFSWDESKATLNMKEGGESKAERVVLADGDDRGEVVGSVGGGEAFIICGSYGDGHSVQRSTYEYFCCRLHLATVDRWRSELYEDGSGHGEALSRNVRVQRYWCDERKTHHTIHAA